MRTRRTIGALALAAVALLAMGCSDGDDEAEDTTTTEATTESTEPTTTLSAEEYSAAIAEFSATVEAAGTDLCAIFETVASGPPLPADEEQMQQVVELYAQLLRALGSAASDEAAAATFNSTADELLVAAEAEGYPTDFLETTDVLTSEDFMAAGQSLSATAATECAPEAPAEGGATTTTVAG